MLSLLALPLAAQSGSYLSYSSYLGGDGEDLIHAMALDSAGNVYVAGETTSSNFPVTASAFQTKRGNAPASLFGFVSGYSPNAFVAKLSPSGKIIWATYLGGSGGDTALAIAVDAKGSAYVLGSTTSPNFPVTPGAYQSGSSKTARAFLAKLSPDGASLVYSALFGPVSAAGYFPGEIQAEPNAPTALAIDSAGNAYFGGSASPASLPATAGAYSNSGSAFVAKLDPTGAKLLLLTYLGGSANSDSVHGLVLDSLGNILAAGSTGATDFPVTSPFAHAPGSNGNSNAFLVKLDPAGARAAFSAAVGGRASSSATAIAVDGQDYAYLTGITTDTNFPVANAFQPKLGGNIDGFLARIDPTGQRFDYSTYFGGSGNDQPFAISVDAADRVTIVGETLSTDFPLTANALPHSFGGAPCLTNGATPFGLPLIPIVCGDGFVVQIDHFANLAYSTYLSGSQTDSVNAVALTPSGNLWLAGHTRSSDFPTAGSPISDTRSPGGCTYSASPSATQSYPCDDGFLANLGFAASPPSLAFSSLNFASRITQPVAPSALFTFYAPNIGAAAATSLQLGARRQTHVDSRRVASHFRWHPGSTPPNFGWPNHRPRAQLHRRQVAHASRSSESDRPDSPGNPPSQPQRPRHPHSRPLRHRAGRRHQPGRLDQLHHSPRCRRLHRLPLRHRRRRHTDPDGSVATAAKNSTGISVILGNSYQIATVLYAGPSPGTISAVTQINVQLPPGLTGDKVPIYFIGGGLTSQSGVTIAIK